MPEEIIHKSDRIKLVKNQKKHNGRKYYQIIVQGYRFELEELEQVRNLVDPNRNKSGAHGTKWRYISKKAAEQAYFNLLLWI